MKGEIKAWAAYFFIALMAELGAAFGWLQAQYREGDSDVIFSVFTMLLEHEKLRLPYWLFIFVALSVLRILVHRLRCQRSFENVEN